MEAKKTYPHFIQSKPCGIDKSEGKSQELLTKAIENHILSTDEGNNSYSLPRIIGLEGSWGAGKSNVIKQLKEKFENKYYLFEYDAWGHQEDLQRRSFLELLTSRLIHEKILNGSTTIKIKGGGKEKVSWEEKLKYLLARKTETKTEKYPRLSNSIIVSFFVAIFVPICIYFGIILDLDNFWLSLLIAIVPVLIAIIIWGIAAFKNEKYRNLDYLLAIYNDKIEKDICYETISEDEPTVTEFKAWMQGISEKIKESIADKNNKEKRKLIVVFDNMDRLPAEKVKELWSSIHTFFSEDGFENIWAIIPFDEEHLSCAFGEAKEEAQKAEIKQLTKYFINKTFPIVYRVTPPVITDFKTMFNTLYEEAFEKTESEKQEEIGRIFRLENSSATVRDMIIFVNQLVALKSIWKNEIDILSMAIFVIKKEDLLEKPISQILSGDYLGDSISKIVSNDEVLQTNISALVYGILPKEAEQIPISRYVENCLKLENDYDINLYNIHKHFLSVLKDRITETDIPIDTLIMGFSKLDSEFTEKNKDAIAKLWDSIAKQKLQMPLVKQEFDDTFKILLSNVNFPYKEKIVDSLCKGLQSIKEFDGEKYYLALSKLEEYIKDNNLNIPIVLEELEKTPLTFVDYAGVAGNKHSTYKLKTNPDELNDYLAEMLDVSVNGSTVWWKTSDSGNSGFSSVKMTNVLNNLSKNDLYKFDKLLAKIEELIKTNSLNADIFKTILDAYKILSKTKPLPVQLNASLKQGILNGLATRFDTPEYFEMMAMQIAHGTNITRAFDEEQIKAIARNIEYYASYGDLLKRSSTQNIPALNQVLNYLTKNSVGKSKLPIREILPLFESIKNRIQISEQDFLNRLDGWSKHAEEITIEEIQIVVPTSQIFQYTVATANDLTNHLNKIVMDALSEKSCEELYVQRQNINDYWMSVIGHFINTDYLNSLPDNLTEFGKKLLHDIAAGRQPIPTSTDLLQKIIDKLDRRKTATLIKNIRNEFCNGQYTMTPQLFKYFEPWFEQQGDLSSRSDVVHKIIEPAINDPDCLNMIISKQDYIDIINNAGDDAMDFKEKIKKMLETNSDEKLIEFAKQIGITIET